MMYIFAQATQVPNNGASNAQDFQPLTRNPQPTQGGLQSGGGPQSTSGQDVLSQENARIVVPVSEPPSESSAPPVVQGGGINWLLVIIAAALIVAALEYFFRRRERRVVHGGFDVAPQEVITLPADTQPTAVDTVAEKPAPTTKKPSTTKKKSKSKSKRKKSRK